MESKLNNSKKINVAAFDTPEDDAVSADFRCDGIADDIEINTAMNCFDYVSILQSQFGNNQWFKSVSDYLAKTYVSIEERMEKTFNFVTLCRDHGSVYSYEFSGILKETGSVFCNVLDEMLRNSIAKPKKYYDFSDYQIFLIKNVKDITSQIVAVKKLFPMILIPYSAFGTIENSPKWWLAYKKVKHHEVFDCKQANLSNSLGSVAALAILGRNLGCFISTKLFYNVGMIYPKDDPAISKERILFNMA